MTNNGRKIRVNTKKLEPVDKTLKRLLRDFGDAARVHDRGEMQAIADPESAASDYLRARNALVRRLNRPRTVFVLMTMHPGRDQARAVFTSEKHGMVWLQDNTPHGDGYYFEEYELDPGIEK